MTLDIMRVGNSAGLILPESLLTRLGATCGDSVEVVPTEDGFALRLVKPATATPSPATATPATQTTGTTKP